MSHILQSLVFRSFVKCWEKRDRDHDCLQVTSNQSINKILFTQLIYRNWEKTKELTLWNCLHFYASALPFISISFLSSEYNTANKTNCKPNCPHFFLSHLSFFFDFGSLTFPWERARSSSDSGSSNLFISCEGTCNKFINESSADKDTHSKFANEISTVKGICVQ
jgi:hypothetical protein